MDFTGHAFCLDCVFVFSAKVLNLRERLFFEHRLNVDNFQYTGNILNLNQNSGE